MSQHIQTPRGIFHVRTYGDPARPAIMLLHGWPQTGYCWHHVAPFLSDHYYVIAPDLRGMGDSNRERDMKFYTKDEMSEDMFAIADALGLEKFYLGGHDWGGAIVQEMAFLRPERVQKLLIVNMVIINNPKGQAAAAEILAKQLYRSSWYQFFLSIKDFPEALLQGKEDIWVRFFSRGISNPVPEEAIQEYIRCYKIPHSITTAANIYRTIPSDRKRWQQYEGKVQPIPTKFIHGILDPVIIKEYLVGVEDYFQQVEIARLKGGHFIVDEQPEAVAKEISSFLNEPK
ncbi:MAG: alpha/beta hydrolase [Bacteroidota bacterium]